MLNPRSTPAPPPRKLGQKGGVENAIGRLKRALPRKIDLAALPHARLNAIIANYNNTPRKCLGYLTPAEIFNPLHFKCESTPASSAGRREKGNVAKGPKSELEM